MEPKAEEWRLVGRIDEAIAIAVRRVDEATASPHLRYRSELEQRVAAVPDRDRPDQMSERANPLKHWRWE